MRAAEYPPHLRGAIPAWEEFTVMREILVIDDDKLTRWSLARVLTRAGYSVQEASSASEGLTRVQEAAPDLIFLDCRLPDGDGASVLQMLQELRPRLPVVMISADATREAVRRLYQLGASAYLEKPCAPASVVALAETLLSHGVAVQSGVPFGAPTSVRIGTGSAEDLALLDAALEGVGFGAR